MGRILAGGEVSALRGEVEDDAAYGAEAGLRSGGKGAVQFGEVYTESGRGE